MQKIKTELIIILSVVQKRPEAVLAPSSVTLLLLPTSVLALIWVADKFGNLFYVVICQWSLVGVLSE